MRNKAVIPLIGLTTLLCTGFLSAQEPSTEEASPSSLDSTYQELLDKVSTEIGNLHEEVNDTGSDNRENIRGTVLSADIVTFSDIPEEVDRQIATQQEAIRRLIEAVASDYETTSNTGTISVSQEGIDYEDLPKQLTDQMEEIQQAGEANNRTIMTVYFTLNIFKDVNNQLIQQALDAENPRDQLRLYSLQAALVYELGKITVDILREVELEGTETLERIKNENQARITSRLADVNTRIQDMQKQVSDGVLDAATANTTEQALGRLIDANQVILSEWDNLVEEASSQGSFMQQLPSFVVKVENQMQLARLQLETLRDVGIVAVALDTTAALEGIALTYSEMPILALDRETVMQLLGVASPEYER